MSLSNTSSNPPSSPSCAARFSRADCPASSRAARSVSSPAIPSPTLPLSQTSFAPPRRLQNCSLLPVNTAAGGLVCTLNTRYEAMALPLDILSLSHYPKTVILIEWFL